MILSQNSRLSQLYEEDFVLWIDETLQQLYNQELEQIDWTHLIEEIEALGREQRRKVDSYLVQLLIHLLLYCYWETEKSYCQKGWEAEIDNFRLELELLFESKTLYNYSLQRLDILYSKARKRAINKTKLSPNIFPENCPFTIEQLLDITFLPSSIL